MSALKRPTVEVFTTPDLSTKTYQRFAGKMHQIAGVFLPESEKNISLVKNRLSKLLRVHSLTTYEELANRLDNPTSALIEQFISALTTNKTHFFREEAHFDFLKAHLQTHFQKEQELRIWCAAASTGQEPYTLAIVVKETVPPSFHRKCKILATDIDLDVLQKGVNGIYTSSECEGLVPHFQHKYLEPHAKAPGAFRVKDELAELVHFSRFNLVQGPYDFRKPFDFIFCRNVLIYFDQPTVKKVISNLSSCLKPNGHLILGHSESGAVNDPKLKALSHATYKRI